MHEDARGRDAPSRFRGEQAGAHGDVGDGLHGKRVGVEHVRAEKDDGGVAEPVRGRVPQPQVTNLLQRVELAQQVLRIALLHDLGRLDPTGAMPPACLSQWPAHMAPALLHTAAGKNDMHGKPCGLKRPRFERLGICHRVTSTAFDHE